jgi:hypothetical protein
MPRYRIYYLKESQRQHFRNAPPAPGPLKIKLKDYQEGGEIEAASPYAAWKQIQGTEDRPLIGVGDVLETDTGALYVCRWAGFEEAQWRLPEEPAAMTAPAGPGDTAPAK